MKSSISPGRSCLTARLWLIPLFIGFVLALFFFFATSPANAAIFISPTPTQENLWAYVSLPKPTYTATSIPLPTDAPLPIPELTATPGQLVMEIVNNPSVAQQNQPAPVA